MAPAISRLDHESFDDFLDNIVKDDLQTYKKKKKERLNIVPKYQLYVKVALYSLDEETEGEKRLGRLIRTLERFDKEFIDEITGKPKFKRSKQQIIFHKAFIGACLKKILGTDYNNVLQKVVLKYQITNVSSDVVIETPRRFGKTTGTAQYGAAFVLEIPTTENSIFSPAKRQSSKLIDKVKDFIILLSGSTDCILSFKDNEILTLINYHKQKTIIGSYPSSTAVCKFAFICIWYR